MCSVHGDTDDSDDKIVVETLDFDGPAQPFGGEAVVPQADEPIRAKGTRQQAPLVRPPDTALTSVPRSTRDVGERTRAAPRTTERALSHTREPTRIPTVRDPIEVLKMWPVSSEPRADTSSARQRATLRAPSPGPQLDEKIKLAHLALDLYRELEIERGGPPLHRGHPGDCADPSCQARANALRGALVEACLLVQRIALTVPGAQRDEVDDRLRDLLALMDH